MRILVVGGTGFLGGAAARAGLAAGHKVTVMTRSGQNVAAGAAVLIADRDQALPDLKGQFDAVIDTCGYAPDMVTRLLQAVGQVHYVFVSSISVYDDMTVPQLGETAHAPPATPDDLNVAAAVAPALRGVADPYGASYGRLKRSCEIAAEQGSDGNCALIRLGLIVGPGDYTDRFTWWVRRCDQDGPLTVPGPPERDIQLIDVDDAAHFLVMAAEKNQSGVFHLTGQPMSMHDMLHTICVETGKAVDIDYQPFSVFTDAGIRHWTDLPFVVPDETNVPHMLNVSTAKAVDVGLRIRPLAQTVRAVLAWDRGRRSIALQAGMSPEQETLVARF